MTIIRWLGRGGQGAFTAARLLGGAYSLEDGKYALAFPSFGPERRGAPVHAFTKLDVKRIVNRSEGEKADFLVFLDDTLFSSDAFSLLKPEGKIIINTKRTFEDNQVVTIDGDTLAAELLGQPITNTIMLGAFSALFDGIKLSDIEAAIRQYMPRKLHEKNIAAIAEAAEIVRGEAVR